jgi:hypothetical protein
MLVSITPTTLNLLSDFLYAIGRVGPDRPQPDHADLQPLIAHVLNRETRRHRMRALQEKDDVGTIGHELFEPRVVAPAEDLRKLVVDFLNDRHRSSMARARSNCSGGPCSGMICGPCDTGCRGSSG